MRDADCIDMTQDIDISENELLRQSPRLLSYSYGIGRGGLTIFWATEDYASMGRGYRSEDRITVKRITGKYGDLIQPRALKTRAATAQSYQGACRGLYPFLGVQCTE